MDGIHPIAIFREPESYEVLSLALADVIKEVAELSLSGIEMEEIDFCTFISFVPVAVFLPWRRLEVPGSCNRY